MRTVLKRTKKKIKSLKKKNYILGLRRGKKISISERKNARKKNPGGKELDVSSDQALVTGQLLEKKTQSDLRVVNGGQHTDIRKT